MYVNGPIKGYQVMPGGTTDYKNYAGKAKITVSSTKPSYNSKAVNDGEIGIYERYEKYEWSSGGEKEGAWVELSWDQPQKVELILVYGSALPERKLKKSHLILDEGSGEVISGINFPAEYRDPVVVRFPRGKDISSLRFVVDHLKDPEGIAGLSEIVILGKE